MKNITSIFLLFYAWAGQAFQSVDINQASEEQIALLPGVGEKLAKSIVSFRQTNKFLSEEQDLLNIPGMREANLKKISGLIIFNRTQSKKLMPKTPKLFISERPMIELAVLEKHALHACGLADDWEGNMVSRTHTSALLPKITLLFDYDRGVDLREKILTNAKNTNDHTLKHGAHGLGLGLRLELNLSELIFHKSELEIASLALKRLEKREKIIERIHVLYFAYKRLQNSGLKPQEPEEIWKIKAELEQTGSLLDSLSKGAFSRFQESVQP